MGVCHEGIPKGWHSDPVSMEGRLSGHVHEHGKLLLTPGHGLCLGQAVLHGWRRSKPTKTNRIPEMIWRK